MNKLLWAWKLCVRFQDNHEAVIAGNDEEDCIVRVAAMQDLHGEVIWYSGYCDEDYVDGEYIGRENFIYEE